MKIETKQNKKNRVTEPTVLEFSLLKLLGSVSNGLQPKCEILCRVLQTMVMHY